MSIWEASQRFDLVAGGKGGGIIDARELASLTATEEEEEEGDRCVSGSKSVGMGRLRVMDEARSLVICGSPEKLAEGEV